MAIPILPRGAERLSLSAYQLLDIQPMENGDYGTGSIPDFSTVRLTTCFDDHFVNRTVTARLNEEDQRKIIAALQKNLERGVVNGDT